MLKPRTVNSLYKIGFTDLNKAEVDKYSTVYSKYKKQQANVLIKDSIIKRALDIIISFVLLMLFAPVLLIISLLIKLTSSGSIFFATERTGLNGRRFVLYKFRTMVYGGEKLQTKLEDLNEEMNGPIFKITNDPRITKVGRLLRKTSLDELPQLFNVLKGDMSLVGPRPLLIYEAEQIDRAYRRRLSIKPGITCFWQTSGRNEIEFEQWMKLDLKYINNWSLGLDLRLLLKTVPIFFKPVSHLEKELVDKDLLRRLLSIKK